MFKLAPEVQKNLAPTILSIWHFCNEITNNSARNNLTIISIDPAIIQKSSQNLFTTLPLIITWI